MSTLPNSSLIALTASALALPGITTDASAATPPTKTTLEYKISSYQEDDLPSSSLLAGDKERYEITVHQFRLLTPIKGDLALSINSSYETMSGASPWYSVNVGKDSPSVVMSGATIHEQRRDLNASIRKFNSDSTFSLAIGASKENDYESLTGGVDYSKEFNNQQTTLSTGISRSIDDISPTDANIFSRVLQASKTTTSSFLSINQIINSTSLLQSSLSYTSSSGYLSDPYKLADRRPHDRKQLAWTNSYRKYLVKYESSIQADLRLYDDNFGINSVTFDISWYKNLNRSIQIIPRLRYYTQSEASFYSRYNDFVGPDYSSSDYRLAAFGAISGILQANWQIDDWNLNLTIERYYTNQSYSIFSGVENDALVNFKRLSIGASYSY